MASVLNACRAGTLTDPKLNNDLRAPLWGGGGGGWGHVGLISLLRSLQTPHIQLTVVLQIITKLFNDVKSQQHALKPCLDNLSRDVTKLTRDIIKSSRDVTPHHHVSSRNAHVTS